MFALAILIGGAIFGAEPLPPGAAGRFGTTRLRTTASVFALSADGQTLHTVTGGRTLGRWDTKSGRLLGEIPLKAPVGAACWFSPDRRSLAIVDAEGIGLYDAETGERKRTVASADKGGMTVAAFSPDGLSLATAVYDNAQRGSGVGRIRVVPVAGGESKVIAVVPSYVNGLAFSPDGKRLFAAVDNHSLHCFDLPNDRELWRNDHWARLVAVSPDGKILASDTYQDGPLRLWDAATGDAIRKLDSGKRSWSRRVEFSRDGKAVGHGTNDGILIWDVKAEKLAHRLPSAGSDFAFAPDGASVYTFGPLLGKWDLRTGAALHPDTRAAGHVGPVSALAFAPDGRYLASIGQDSTLRIWDRATGEHGVHKVRPGAPLVYTPDGRLVVPGDKPGTLTLMEPATGRVIRTFALTQMPPAVTSVVTSVSGARVTPDGKTLFAWENTPRSGFTSDLIKEDQPEPVAYWTLATGKASSLKTVPVPLWDSVALSPSGRFVAGGGWSELLDVNTGMRRPLRPTPVGNRGDPCLCTFSPDGRWLASVELADARLAYIKSIRVYEALTGRRLAELKDVGVAPGMSAMEFSPDGRLLAASGTDALHVWEAATGRRVLHLPARGRLPNWEGRWFAECLAFAPDGRTVATGHNDGTILLWDMAPAWKNLTAAEAPGDAAACWNALADPDPKIAWAAVGRLVADPPAALRLLGERLKPDTVEARWVADRIADLAGRDYKTRVAATADLKRVAEMAGPQLVEARRTATSAEVQLRLDEVLDHAPQIPPDDAVRRLRALAVLERIGTRGATDLLKALAGGAPAAELTREAEAALDRHRAR